MNRLWLTIGFLLGGAAVIAGTIGAHGLDGRTSAPLIATFEVGVRYQFYHALLLIACGAAWPALNSRWGAAGGWLIVAGTLLFCGSLYAMAFGAPRPLGWVAASGGTLLIAGWITLARAAASRSAAPPLRSACNEDTTSDV